MDLGLSDRVVIVTGGASNIGRAIAQCFASEGAKVAIFDRDETMARRTVASRDAQVKKLAAKLADMERGIGKAHEESTRLTELLIDRENKLKNVRVAFEKDYEERFKSMERQITGLEWKLSLRDDRIGALEQELGHTTGKVLPPPTPRQPEV